MCSSKAENIVNKDACIDTEYPHHIMATVYKTEYRYINAYSISLLVIIHLDSVMLICLVWCIMKYNTYLIERVQYWPGDVSESLHFASAGDTSRWYLSSWSTDGALQTTYTRETHSYCCPLAATCATTRPRHVVDGHSLISHWKNTWKCEAIWWKRFHRICWHATAMWAFLYNRICILGVLLDPASVPRIYSADIWGR